MTLEEFQRVLRDAGDRVGGSRARAWGVRIADLRRAVGDAVPRGEFDDLVRRLRDDGHVVLTPHERPELLGFASRQDSLEDGARTYYFLRWLS